MKYLWWLPVSHASGQEVKEHRKLTLPRKSLAMVEQMIWSLATNDERCSTFSAKLNLRTCLIFASCKFFSGRNTKGRVLKEKINPLHPNISMHILQSFFLSFSKVMTRRICLTIKGFFGWSPFILLLWSLCLIQGWFCTEKSDARYP